MDRYEVFGGTLESQIPFPELRYAPGTRPDWTLEQRALGPLPPDAEPLGEDTVDGPVHVRLLHSSGAYRLVFDDTGAFDVSENGKVLVWEPAPGADVYHARLDILGRVLPIALHARGVLCLHGSAVAFETGGIGFLAPKMHGKSTLAQALLRAGARLATDDTIPVVPGHPLVRMRPGVPSVRLWSDSAERLYPGPRPPGGSGKIDLQPPSEDRLLRHVTPLLAVYLLDPVVPGPDVPPVRRSRIPPVAAAMSLVRHAKLGPLLTGAESPKLLDRAVEVARSVAVYSLHVARDFDLLDDVAEKIFEWHTADMPAEKPLVR